MEGAEIARRAERLGEALAETIHREVPSPTTDAEIAIGFLGLANVLGALLGAMPPVYREAHLLGFIETAISAFRFALDDAAEARNGG